MVQLVPALRLNGLHELHGTGRLRQGQAERLRALQRKPEIFRKHTVSAAGRS